MSWRASPTSFLIGAKGGKAVLRASMEKLLPPRILHRKKVGFRVPFGRWLRGPYRDFARDMLDSEASRLAQICNRAKLRSLLSEHVEGRQNHERVLWSLINLEIFLRVFKPSQLEEAAWSCAQESRVTVIADGFSRVPLKRI